MHANYERKFYFCKLLSKKEILLVFYIFYIYNFYAYRAKIRIRMNQKRSIHRSSMTETKRFETVTLPLNIVNFVSHLLQYCLLNSRDRREGKVFQEKKEWSEVDDTAERWNIKGRTRFYRSCWVNRFTCFARHFFLFLVYSKSNENCYTISTGLILTHKISILFLDIFDIVLDCTFLIIFLISDLVSVTLM